MYSTENKEEENDENITQMRLGKTPDKMQTRIESEFLTVQLGSFELEFKTKLFKKMPIGSRQRDDKIAKEKSKC